MMALRCAEDCYSAFSKAVFETLRRGTGLQIQQHCSKMDVLYTLLVLLTTMPFNSQPAKYCVAIAAC